MENDDLDTFFIEDAVYDAIEQNNYDRFLSLINREDFYVNHGDCNGRTFLTEVMRIPNGAKFAKELVQKGSDVDYPDINGHTFLHLGAFAKEIDNLETGQLLIENGADVDYPNEFGLTPLYVACSEGNLDWIYLLLYYGADASITTYYEGLPPLCALSPSLITDDYDNLVDILFLHTYGNQPSSVPLSTLAEIMSMDSSLFPKIAKHTFDVVCNKRSVTYFCRYFGDIKPQHFKLFLEKFEDVMFALIEKKDFLHVIITQRNSRQMYQILDYLLFSKYVDKIIRRSTASTFTISQYTEKFAATHPAKEIRERIFIMLSYGLEVTCKDLDTVYQHYGYCDLFKTLLHLDLISTKKQSVSSFIRLHCNPGLSIKDCCDDVSSASVLLRYFNHPKLKELCLSTTEDTELKKQVLQMPQIPCLVELSRNAARKYIVRLFKIKTCKKFHAVVNRLPVHRIAKSIIAMERRIY